MIINPRKINLKDGRTATLRSPEQKDAESLVKILNITARESDFIIRTPKDCYRYTVESETENIIKKNDSQREVMIICEIDDEFAGICSIYWKDFEKVKHTANINIALCKKYWNLGIGTEMLKEMIRIAEEIRFITQIKTSYIEGNYNARALYEKLGFKITGVEPRSIRLKNGQYLDQYEMMKILE